MDSYFSNLNRINPAFRCDVISQAIHLEEVLQVEKQVFPEYMQDELHEIEEFFDDVYSHGLILRKGKVPVGVLKGHHLDERNTESELLKQSPLREIADKTFYMDSVGLLKGVRSNQVLDFLMHEMNADLRRFDYRYIAAHVRVKSGVSRLFQRRYKAKVLVRYPNRKGFDEPFDYILVDLNDFPIQSAFRRGIYRLIRRIYQLLS